MFNWGNRRHNASFSIVSSWKKRSSGVWENFVLLRKEVFVHPSSIRNWSDVWLWPTWLPHMCRVLPKLRPLWLAPLLEPYCNEMTVSPARNCSSVNWRAFFSASLGPMAGLPNLAPCFFPQEEELRSDGVSLAVNGRAVQASFLQLPMFSRQPALESR